MDEWFSLLANNVDSNDDPLEVEDWSTEALETLIRLAQTELKRRGHSATGDA